MAPLRKLEKLILSKKIARPHVKSFGLDGLFQIVKVVCLQSNGELEVLITEINNP